VKRVSRPKGPIDLSSAIALADSPASVEVALIASVSKLVVASAGVERNRNSGRSKPENLDLIGTLYLEFLLFSVFKYYSSAWTFHVVGGRAAWCGPKALSLSRRSGLFLSLLFAEVGRYLMALIFSVSLHSQG
jgi:hypothetical protein